ncbi:S-adenosyl-L-methionine-dependent methyltransferase [Melanomma pulvis-pyrius CBS 109.77]|uniref:S-adenosyl-L-methionine-dependent methyltransferase n=1 Tax=Melanomma pulvis-pyrius CBS 109.77 TaxID=1314802 RepID=A0A6A6WPX8_9PLEO|nr:S-adenosyl-L-methionine-dependent methyltransferase [Melanomma pulvis-pyrius CBS 109.77]
MTQPTSIDMTFDTSLVDLNASFSTTESDPSDAGLSTAYASSMKTPTLPPASLSPGPSQETPKQTQVASQLPRTSTPAQHIPTQEAYDQWASIYDSDGNMLQAIDDDELSTLLPAFILQVLSNTPTESPSISLVDLGCGTGRNTMKLISYAWPATYSIHITALDFSSGMLDVAAKKIDALPLNDAKHANPTTRLEQCDCFPTVSSPTSPPLPSVPDLHPVQAVISTLVLEHIPLPDYFSTLSSLLVKGGYALVTNMHSEMGRISQAGFVNEAGVKVRGESFAHGVDETGEAARRAGFEVLEVRERRVERGDLEKGIVGERGGKWVGVLVWYGILLRKVV